MVSPFCLACQKGSNVNYVPAFSFQKATKVPFKNFLTLLCVIDVVVVTRFQNIIWLHYIHSSSIGLLLSKRVRLYWLMVCLTSAWLPLPPVTGCCCLCCAALYCLIMLTDFTMYIFSFWLLEPHHSNRIVFNELWLHVFPEMNGNALYDTKFMSDDDISSV